MKDNKEKPTDFEAIKAAMQQINNCTIGSVNYPFVAQYGIGYNIDSQSNIKITEISLLT